MKAPAWLARTAAELPDKVALETRAGVWTYGELLARADAAC
jgi:hypothetical protein